MRRGLREKDILKIGYIISERHNSTTTISVAVILVTGLVLRCYGIRWGLPDLSHPGYSYHPDEVSHLIAADSLSAGRIFPKHFMYGGTFYFSLLGSYIYFSDLLSGYLGALNGLANCILFGRYFLTAVALITIALLFEVGRQLFNKKVGMLAALLLAISPAHIVWAQRVRPDEICALIAVVILYLSVKILRSGEENIHRYFIYSGLAAGIALATRFPLLVLAIMPLTAALLAKGTINISRALGIIADKRVIILFLFVAVAYSAASPHTFLYPREFVEGLKIQWRYQSAPFADAVGRGPGVYQYGWLMLHQALGYPIYFIALSGAILAFIKRSREDGLILAGVIPYFVLTSLASWVVVRYALPLVPFLCLFAARAVLYWTENLSRYRTAAISALLGIVLWTLSGDIAYLKLEAGKDIRDVASEWIARNITPGARILMVRTYLEDTFFNPVIPTGYKPDFFLLKEWYDSRSLFEGLEYDYIILHELLYKNMERLGERHPSRQSRIFFKSLMQNPYQLIKEFKNPASFLGVDFSSSFTSRDYSVVNPGIRIYRLAVEKQI